MNCQLDEWLESERSQEPEDVVDLGQVFRKTSKSRFPMEAFLLYEKQACLVKDTGMRADVAGK